MTRHKILYIQFAVVTALVILDVYFGIDKNYYWRYPWFDIVTHLVGGLWAGFFGAWLFIVQRKVPRFLYCVAIAFTIGIAWEIFEAITGITSFPADTLDTIKDLCVDVVGGSTAAFIATRSRHS